MTSWQILAAGAVVGFLTLVVAALIAPDRARRVLQIFTRSYEHVESARKGKPLRPDLAGTISKPIEPPAKRHTPSSSASRKREDR